MDFLIYLILIIVIILYLIPYRKKKNEENLNKDKNKMLNFDQSLSIEKFNNYSSLQNFDLKKPFIWIYLEEEYNSRKWSSFGSRVTLGNMESYLIICLYLVYKNCHQDFNIVVLNDQNIFYYLPNLNIKMGPDSVIPLNQRRDLISYMLLYYYGGIWYNPHTILMKNLYPIYQLTQQYDMILFGCPSEYYQCNYGYLKPGRQVIISRPNLKINYLCFKEIYKKIQEQMTPAYNFNLTGDCIFWKYLKQLSYYDNFNYLHLNSQYDGTRDYNHKLISIENWLSTNQTLFLNENKIIFVSLNQQQINQHFHYKWFIRYSLNQILNSQLWIASLFRKALKIPDKYFYDNQNFDHTNIQETIKIPPINIEQLEELFYISNYFSKPLWDKVYNQ